MAIDYIMVGAGVVAIAAVSLTVAEIRRRIRVTRLEACGKEVADSKCPRCEHSLGAGAIASATQTRQRFFGLKGRLRGRESPYRLLRVACPHCSAELHFRLDASLFSCDHVVLTQQNIGPTDDSAPTLKPDPTTATSTPPPAL